MEEMIYGFDDNSKTRKVQDVSSAFGKKESVCVPEKLS